MKTSWVYRTSPNLTSRLNAANSFEKLAKWGHERSPAQGIPRKDRLSMTSINIIHETRDILIAGRNRCNNFMSNQFLVSSKHTKEAIMIDASDDWMDDWVAFVKQANLSLKYVFCTHLHLDNVLNFAPLLQMIPGVKLAYSVADRLWVEEYRRACSRYRRLEFANIPLPFFRSHATYGDVLLNAGANRRHSCLQLGETLLFNIPSPGHSMGHHMLHLPLQKVLFSGDLIMYNGVGRVDLPEATGELLAQSLRRLEDFPDKTVLLPGHGRMTTLGRERRHNLPLRRLYQFLDGGKQVPNIGQNAGYL